MAAEATVIWLLVGAVVVVGLIVALVVYAGRAFESVPWDGLE